MSYSLELLNWHLRSSKGVVELIKSQNLNRKDLLEIEYNRIKDLEENIDFLTNRESKTSF